MTFFQNLRLYAAGVQVQQQALQNINQNAVRIHAYDIWANEIMHEPCGFCGSRSGYHINASGWSSCNNCEGV